MKKITQFLIVLTILVSVSSYGQLSDKHYLPPLKQVSNNNAIREQAVYLSAPLSEGTFNVNVFRGTNTGTPDLVITGLSHGTPYTLDSATAGFALTDGDNNITLVNNSNTGTVLTNSGLRFESVGGEKFYVNYRGRSNSQAGSLTSKGVAAAGRDFRWGGIANHADNENLTTSLGIMAIDPGVTTIQVFGYNQDCIFREPTGIPASSPDALTIQLSQYETYVIEAPKNSTGTTQIPANIDGWLGASITSDNRIVISNGGLNTGVQTGQQARDTGIDQSVPTTALGREYVFVRGAGAANNRTEFAIIVGTQNGTEVFAGGVSQGIINNGDYMEVAQWSSNVPGANMFIETSKEAYAFQCLSGQSPTRTLGMNFIAPVNCLLPSILDEVSEIDQIAGTASNISALTIIAAPISTVTITDGTGAITTPTAVPVSGTTDWVTYYVDGLVGEVDVSSTGPIAVGTFMGLGNNAGLAGYFSGFDTIPVVDLDVAGGGCFPGTTLSEITGGFDAYQWYIDGSPIVGATMNTYVPSVIGNYYVEVTKGTCTYTSAVLTVFYCNPEIKVTKTDNEVAIAPVLEGDNVTFTITIESLGINPVTNLVVNDALPSGLTLVSATPSYGTWTDPNWTIGTMNAGEVHTLTVVAQATIGTEGTTVTNVVSHTQDQTDTNLETDDLTEDVTISDGEISITKADALVDGGNGVQAGDTIDYTFVITNGGVLDLNTITLTDPLLPGSPILITGATGDNDGDDILDVGEVWTYTATYTITQDDIDIGNVTNSAAISGTQSNGTIQTDDSDDPDDTTNVDDNADGEPDDDTITNLPEEPGINLLKTSAINDGGDGIANAGDTITYTFTVTNTGNISLTTVVVNDPLLGGVVTGPASGDTDTDSELDVTETWVYTGTYTILQTDLDAGSVTNDAVVTADSTLGTGVTDNSDDPNDATDVDDNADGDPDDDTVTMLTPNPSMEAVKTAAVGGTNVGDTITYTITVENTGNVTLNNVAIVDTLTDANGGALTLTTGPTYTSGSLGSLEGTLLVGETATYTATFVLTQAAIDAGGVSNSVVASGDDPNGTGVNDTSDDNDDTDGNTTDDTTDVTITANPSMEAVKTAAVGGTNVGDTITYTITVENTGNVTLNNVAIVDTLTDANGGALTLTTGPTYTSGSLGSLEGTLLVGETATYTATFVLTQAAIDAGGVSNSVVASGDDPNGTGVNDTSDDNDDTDGNTTDDTTDVTITANPSMEAVKTAAVGGTNVGDTITYTITVENTGNVTLNNVAIVDTLTDANGGALTLTTGPTYTSGSLGSLEGTLLVGETATYTATFVLTQAAIDAGGVSNSVVASGDDPNGTGVNDTSDDNDDTDGNTTDDTTDVTITANPSMEAVKTAAVGGTNVGDTITYTITVENTGNVTLNNVAIVDTLTDANGGALTLTTGPTYTSGSLGSLEGTLLVGETATYTATFVLTQAAIDAGGVSNSVVASGDDPNGTGVNDTSDDNDDTDGNTTDDTTDVTITANPSMEAVKTAAVGGTNVGDTITYTITVENTGNVTLNNVAIVDTLTDANGGALTLTTGPTYTSGSLGSLEGTLLVGETATYTATFVLTQAAIDAGGVSNSVVASGDDPNGTGVNDTSDDNDDTDGNTTDDTTDVTITANPSMEAVKTAAVGGTNVGDTITYTITVENTGNVTLNNVAIVDTLTDANGGALTLTTGPTYTSGSLGSLEGTLLVGETATYTATFVLTQAAIDAGGVSNSVVASGDDPNGTGVNDTSDDNDDTDGNTTDDTTDVTITANPSMEAVKTAAVGGTNVGDTITYTITVENTGNVTLNNVAIVDTLTDANGGALTLTTGPTYTSGSLGSLEGTLLVGETATYTATFVLTQAAIDAGGVSNSVVASGDDPNGTGVNDTSDDNDDTDGNTTDDTTDVTITANPGVNLLKTSSLDLGTDGILNVGDVITYTFILENTGNVSISNVVVNDPLLGGVIAGPVTGDDDSDNELDSVETWTYTSTYSVTQTDIDNGEVVNSATIDGNIPGGGTVSDNSDDPNNTTDVDDNGDGNPDDDTVTTLPATPSISLTKEVLPAVDGNYDTVGEVIVYELIVTNTGNVTLTNVVITDANADVGSISPSNIATLAPGASVTIAAEHTITQADLDLGSVTNVATAIGNTPDGSQVSDESDDPTNSADVDNNGDGEPDDPTVIGIPQEFSIDITKVALPATDGNYDAIGEVITYEIIVTNTSTVTLTNVVITDANADVGSILPSNIATLAPGESVTVTAEHTITQADIIAGEVINVAVVEGTIPGGTVVADESDDPTNSADVDNNGDGNPDDPTITELASCEVEVFNLMTPNGDGDNDYLQIPSLACHPDNEVQIYNRWGVLVYETRFYDTVGNVFRGISEGRVTVQKSEELPVGTYYYIIKYTDSRTEKGNSKSGYLYINR